MIFSIFIPEKAKIMQLPPLKIWLVLFQQDPFKLKLHLLYIRGEGEQKKSIEQLCKIISCFFKLIT